LKNINKFVILR